MPRITAMVTIGVVFLLAHCHGADNPDKRLQGTLQYITDNNPVLSDQQQHNDFDWQQFLHDPDPELESESDMGQLQPGINDYSNPTQNHLVAAEPDQLESVGGSTLVDNTDYLYQTTKHGFFPQQKSWRTGKIAAYPQTVSLPILDLTTNSNSMLAHQPKTYQAADGEWRTTDLATAVPPPELRDAIEKELEKMSPAMRPTDY
ncbi:hypothetical protein H4R34_004920, partial [Dimargaris verticillata]